MYPHLFAQIVGGTATPPPSPYWLMAAAAIGAAGAVAAQILAHFLTRGRELSRFRIETFERLRREFEENEEVRRIYAKKEEPLTPAEIEVLLDFFEGIAYYAEKGIVSEDDVDAFLGDAIIECFEDDDIMGYVGKVRGEERDPEYWEYFERLAKRLVAIRDKRRARRT